LTTQLKLITTSDQVNITTNPKGEKAAAKGFPFSFSFLFFSFPTSFYFYFPRTTFNNRNKQ